MADIINYIWQSSFCLLFLFGIYWCFLRGEKVFTLTRIYILAAPVLAFLFPLIEIPVDFTKPNISLENTEFLQSLASFEEEEKNIIGTFGLPEFTVKSTKLPVLLEFRDYLIIGYLCIVLFLVMRLLWQFLQFNMLLRKGWYQTIFKLKGNYFLVPTFGLAPAFSFFDKLFWDDTQELLPAEKEHIIRHEIEHIKQKHSWDIVYYQLLETFFWFNPAIHLMRAALVDTHEYMVDATVLKESNNKNLYRNLIVKIAFKGLDLPIGNHFIRSKTLKRIMMMKKSSKINWFKLIMVVPLTAMLMALVSMKTQMDTGMEKRTLPLDISLIERQILNAQDSVHVTAKVKKILHPVVHDEYVSGRKNGKVIAQLGQLQYEIGDISNMVEYRQVLEMIDTFKHNYYIPKEKKIQKGVSIEVEKMASPAGGMEAWNSFLANNLIITPEARELGADGAVHVDFIVDRDGNIHSPTIRKSLGMGLDDEALRVLSLPSAPKWIPGENNGEKVNTQVTVPIKFTCEQVAGRKPLLPSSQATEMIQVNHEEAEVFDLAETMPIPRGGVEDWNHYLSKNLRYPQTARDAGIEGTVYVAFTVNKDGEIVDPAILRGIGGGADEEAIRVIQGAPHWIPGEQRGEKVNVRMRIPIRFKLQHIGQEKTSENSLLLGEKINIVLLDESHTLMNGSPVKINDLAKEISTRFEMKNDKPLEAGQITALISANKDIKMGQVNDVQAVLRTLGIYKINYLGHDNASPFLSTNP